jgi:hypothetical protein
VNRDGISSSLGGDSSGLHDRRLTPSPCISKGSDVVDINSKVNHVGSLN